jgi:flagellin
VSDGLGIGRNASKIIENDSGSPALNGEDVFFDDGGKIDNTYQLTDNSTNGQIELQDGGGNALAGSGTVTDGEISGSSSDALTDDGELVDALEGGEFDLKFSDGGAADGSFQVEVNGGGLGSAQTIADGDGTGTTNDAIGDASGSTTVTLEEGTKDDGTDVSLQLDFSDATASSLQEAIDNNDGELEASVKVGGDGIEFTNDVAESAEERENAISNIDSAIDQLTGNLSDLGATQNRLSFKEGNLETARTNLNAAQSRIEDADFAREQTQVAKLQVQQQSGTAQLAQANAAGQSVLSLLG